jgi:hypothetical protein
MMRVRYETSTNAQYREGLDFNKCSLRSSISFIEGYLFELTKALVSVAAFDHACKTINKSTATCDTVMVPSLSQVTGH